MLLCVFFFHDIVLAFFLIFFVRRSIKVHEHGGIHIRPLHLRFDKRHVGSGKQRSQGGRQNDRKCGLFCCQVRQDESCREIGSCNCHVHGCRHTECTNLHWNKGEQTVDCPAQRGATAKDGENVSTAVSSRHGEGNSNQLCDSHHHCRAKARHFKARCPSGGPHVFQCRSWCHGPHGLEFVLAPKHGLRHQYSHANHNDGAG
mmetsp:Transcript_13580/g.29822  ORF Transcript_13580/g.29822 Transcript_13580/m.29822 type:complete len:202 (+) Transcript_13580:203-808(+)